MRLLSLKTAHCKAPNALLVLAMHWSTSASSLPLNQTSELRYIYHHGANLSQVQCWCTEVTKTQWLVSHCRCLVGWKLLLQAIIILVLSICIWCPCMCIQEQKYQRYQNAKNEQSPLWLSQRYIETIMTDERQIAMRFVLHLLPLMSESLCVYLYRCKGILSCLLWSRNWSYTPNVC